MKRVPISPENLAARLAEIFPAVEDFAALDEDDGPLTMHEVWRRFAPKFSAAVTHEAQLQALGELAGDCVAAGGVWENAVSTCFLEHLHQIHARKILWPFLSASARQRTRV